MNKDWFYDNPSLIPDAMVDGLQIDLIGHGIEKSTNPVIDFLSYYGPKNSIQPYQEMEFNSGVGPTFENGLIFSASGATPNATLDATSDFLLSGATDASNLMTLYGPNHPEVGVTYSSSFATQAEWETFATSVLATTSYVSVGITGSGATSANGFNASRVLESDLRISTNGVSKDELVIRISASSEDGLVSGSTATDQWFSLGMTAGSDDFAGTLTADIEVIPSLDYCYNPVGSGVAHSIMYGGPASQLGIDTNTGIITTGDNQQSIEQAIWALNIDHNLKSKGLI